MSSLGVFLFSLGFLWQINAWSLAQIKIPQETSKKVLAAQDEIDQRIVLLESFLKDQGSPLASQAGVLVEAADKYKFDWRLLPAIAGKESSFGKRIPWHKEDGRSSHNAWGWGVYGDKAPSFSSWEEAIEEVAKGLRHEYYNKGYILPETIMKKFTPRSDGSWARGVKAIMEQITPTQEYE